MKILRTVLILLVLIVLVAACGGGGGSSSSNPGNNTGDTTPPSTPTGLTLTVVNGSRIDLTWDAATDNVGVAGYKIYRDGSYHGSITSTQVLPFSDAGLTANTQYCYQVSAFDLANNESQKSAQQCATPTDTWTSRNPASGVGVQGIAYSGSVYVAVGNQAAALVSPDSITWSKKTAVKLNRVIWDGTRFIGSSDQTSYGVYTSTNGDSWSAVTSAPASAVSIASGPVYVAGSADGSIMTSPDLVTWTTRTSGMAGAAQDVIWGGGQFVAVTGDGKILTSPDGAVWTPRLSTSGVAFVKAVWSGSVYLVVNAAGTSYTSTDGTVWTANVPQALDHAAWSPVLNMFVGTYQTQTYTSSNGTSWTAAGHLPDYAAALLWDGSQFLISCSTNMILTSPDGANWTIRASGEDLRTVIWTGSRFMAVGSFGTIASSADGITWTYQELTYLNASSAVTNGGFLRDIAVTAANKIVVGGQSAIFTSGTGSLWSASTGTVSAYGVAWSGSAFAGVSSSGMAYSSADGAAWTSYALTDAYSPFYDVIWDGAKFVAVGQNVTYTSPDGSTWTRQSPGISGQTFRVAWSGSTYVAVGAWGLILTSPDAQTWTAQTSGTSVFLYGVAWTGSQFIAVGDSDVVLISTNGINWTRNVLSLSYSGTLNGAASNGTRDVVVGNGGVILTRN